MNYQIPWFVVEAAYTELSKLSNKLSDTPITKIGYLFCHDCNPAKFDGGGTVPEGGFKHLLHIFHWSRSLDGMYVVDTSIPKCIGQFNIPSATELQLSQTVFINDGGGSVDVSYGDGTMSGVMQLTPWRLFQYSTKLYESLLIFEQDYVPVGKPFTAYVACMACLLKTEADVRIMRAKDIIPNTSFDDKNVLRCVQDLKAFFHDNLYMPNELVILEKKVMAHHKKSVYRIIGEFKKRYCSNPWIIISAIAGILLFALTFIQTLYGTLSYYKQ